MHQILNALAILFSMLTAVAALVVIVTAFIGSQYESSFASIEIGMTQTAIITQLGEPVSISTECYVAQFVEYEKSAEWADKSIATHCAHWIMPGFMGKYFVVGFGVDGRVVGIAYGDS